jgi:hypothetical protein
LAAGSFERGKYGSILRMLKWLPGKGLWLAGIVNRDRAAKRDKLAVAEAREAQATF